MKKFLLILAMLPIVAMAQIGPIQTQEKPYEFLSDNNLYRTVATDEYTLQILSDNQFETTAIKLNLGHGAEEAIASLSSLFALFGNGDSDFDLQGYNFAVRGRRIIAYHKGKLEYTAGEYVLSQVNAAMIMEDLLEAKQLPLKEVTVSFAGYSSVYVNYETYGFKRVYNFNNVTLPLSHKYNEGERISDKDIANLKKAAENPNSYRSNPKRGANVLWKERFIRVCDVILQTEVK